jgi:ribose transport system permease protein
MTALRIPVLRSIPPIWLIFFAVFAVTIWRDDSFAEPPSLMAFLKRSAPLAVLAIGQLFVIVAGEFDLSVGALITACVVIAARLGEGEPGRTWWVILLLAGLGLVVGVINGAVTTFLKVPSFITTLGMMLVLNGAVFLWTGGSPTGALAQNFRRFGREGINGVPSVGQIPYSVIILVVVTAIATILLHHNRFGHQVFATGGGPRAAYLSGVDTRRTRIGAFVISAESAVIAGILLGGFAGLSAEAGSGYEFQAISAVVLGGAVLGGGRGTVGATVGGALTLQAMFTLLNLLGMAKPLRDTVQGLLIIAAVAFAAYRLRASR